MQGLKTPRSLMQFGFHSLYLQNKCPLVVDGSVLKEKMFFFIISTLKNWINWEITDIEFI